MTNIPAEEEIFRWVCSGRHEQVCGQSDAVIYRDPDMLNSHTVAVEVELRCAGFGIGAAMTNRTVKAISRSFLVCILEVRLDNRVHNIARLVLIFPPLDLIGLLMSVGQALLPGY